MTRSAAGVAVVPKGMLSSILNLGLLLLVLNVAQMVDGGFDRGLHVSEFFPGSLPVWLPYA